MEQPQHGGGQRCRLDGFDLFSLFLVLALALLALSLVLAAGGCAPATDLTAGGIGGEPEAPPSSGGALVDPAAGASGVPVNLAALIVRFPGAVMLPPGALTVCEGALPAVDVALLEAAPCDGAVAPPGGAAASCYRAALAGPLPPAAACRVALGPGATDADGLPLAAGLIGVFETAAAADTTPPVVDGLSVELAGPCLAVRFATDEPATGAVVVRTAEAELVLPAGAGQSTFDLAVPASLLPPLTAATVAARATDRAGNLAESAPLALTTPAPLPPLAITEVLANPAGAEPAQEYVELRNLGDEALPLDGLQVRDSRGADTLPAAMLPAGAYALVVTSAYDSSGATDPAPRPGTLLLRVDTRIGTDGLSNGGEPVQLVQGDLVISSYGGWVDVSSSAWSGHAVHRLAQTACDRPDAWNRTPLAATPGNGPP